ncbi:MAG TPA: zf-HC2 domain-containing protein [Vicinamibacteria bacterium]
MFAHWRLRRRVTLLAADALTGADRARVLSHLEACARCRVEYDETKRVLDLLEEDPLRPEVRHGDLPVSSSVLLARVEEGIDRALAGPQAAPSRPPGAGRWAALAAALAMALGLPSLFERTTAPDPAGGASTPEVSAAALQRLERNVAREQTARYLNEAQDVLATVASSPRDCDETERRVDVEAESRRSRELLARRALLLDAHEGAVAGAQPVLDDVEQILREVASMEACVRFRDMERLQDEIERRQLLMKVRLMQRELLG